MTQQMTSSFHAKHHPLINLVVITRLVVYNSKSSKPNKSASLFRREDLTIFKSSHPASSMAQSSACCSSCQNPHDGKDEFVSRTPTEGSNRRTPAPAATRVSFLLLHLLLLRLLLLVLQTPLWLNTWRMTSSEFLKPFEILDLLHLFRLPLLPPLCTMKAYMSGLWKLCFQTFIWVKLTWGVIISSSSAKITLPLPVLWAQIEFCLRLCSWRIPPCFAGSNISVR